MRVDHEKKSLGVRVDHEKKSKGVTVDHKKKSDGVRVHHEKKSDWVRFTMRERTMVFTIHHEKERWGESSPKEKAMG